MPAAYEGTDIIEPFFNEINPFGICEILNGQAIVTPVRQKEPLPKAKVLLLCNVY